MGIKLFGKNIFQVYKHHIMRLEYSEIQKLPMPLDLLLEKIDKSNILKELSEVGTKVSVTNLKHLVNRNGSLCEGFVLKTEENLPIGTLWVMYKGAGDLEYRISSIDAYIFNVFVNSSFRGRGYAGNMIRLLMEYLHQKDIDEAYLAVSTNNSSAIRAYKKAGFTTIYDRSLVRVLKVNFPYHKL